MSAARPFFSFFPQFTPDPLNDRAWGPGFTDWDLVRALPTFEQDRFTPARGFYDPTTADYLPALQDELQALSPKAGVVVYHYFFDGRHVLPGFERQMLTQRRALPFFICWANETWSKRWVGQPNDLIVSQHHRPDPAVITSHTAHLARLFDLPGYERYGDRPLLLIYNPHASLSLAHAIELYREAFARLGVNPFIGACLSYPQPASHMQPYDFGCEFEPRFFFNSGGRPGLARLGVRLKASFPRAFEWLGSRRDAMRMRAGQNEFAFAAYLRMLADGSLERELRHSVGALPLMRSTFLSWDNTPRYGDRSTRVNYHGVDAAVLSHSLLGLHSDLDLPLFVNSWNEWSEGAALEPGRQTLPLRAPLLDALGLRT